jgi:hypothetical protein
VTFFWILLGIIVYFRVAQGYVQKIKNCDKNFLIATDCLITINCKRFAQNATAGNKNLGVTKNHAGEIQQKT